MDELVIFSLLDILASTSHDPAQAVNRYRLDSDLDAFNYEGSPGCSKNG
jgi:hypothetical protein